jgi:hypothetical protein
MLGIDTRRLARAANVTIDANFDVSIYILRCYKPLFFIFYAINVIGLGLHHLEITNYPFVENG